MSLYQLQLIIDNGGINVEEPIDLASLANSHFYKINPTHQHYGVNLKEEGGDLFRSKINIEVQYASEPVIAAIEKNGGTITTAYFDLKSVIALVNPLKFFEKGRSWFLLTFIITICCFFVIQASQYQKGPFPQRMPSNIIQIPKIEDTWPTLKQWRWNENCWHKSTDMSCPKKSNH